MPKAAPLKPKTAKHAGGAPSKKTPATLEAALSAAREGLPLRFCAGLAGISYQTLNEYRKADPGFDQRLETAMSEGVQAKMRKILEAGNRDAPGSWQALAWSLERAHAHEFSRPEIQLHALTQINQTTNNTLVITAEAASALEKRIEPINREIDELMRAHEAKRGLGREGVNGAVREVEVATSLVSGPLTLPPVNQRTASWWRQLSTGDGARRISREAAEYVLRAVAAEVLGTAGIRLEIDFDGGDQTLSDVWNTLQKLVGPRGWQALVKKGEA